MKVIFENQAFFSMVFLCSCLYSSQRRKNLMFVSSGCIFPESLSGCCTLLDKETHVRRSIRRVFKCKWILSSVTWRVCTWTLSSVAWIACLCILVSKWTLSGVAWSVRESKLSVAELKEIGCECKWTWSTVASWCVQVNVNVLTCHNGSSNPKHHGQALRPNKSTFLLMSTVHIHIARGSRYYPCRQGATKLVLKGPVETLRETSWEAHIHVSWVTIYYVASGQRLPENHHAIHGLNELWPWLQVRKLWMSPEAITYSCFMSWSRPAHYGPVDHGGRSWIMDDHLVVDGQSMISDNPKKSRIDSEQKREID